MGCADQDVYACFFHVDPQRTGGHAVEDKQSAYAVRCVGQGTHVVIRQDHACGGFHVGCKYQVWFGFLDVSHHLVDGCWRELVVAHMLGFEDIMTRGDLAGVKDL